MKRVYPVSVKIVKGTADEKKAYKATKPVYPMYGFAILTDKKTKQKMSVVIEDLRGFWRAPDPLYEVIAPKGYIFESDDCHTLLAHTLADAKSRVQYELPVKCNCHECAEYWASQNK